MTQRIPKNNGARISRREQRRRRVRRNRIIALLAAALILALVTVFICLAVTKCKSAGNTDKENTTESGEDTASEATQRSEEESTEPYVTGTASIGATGDILLHNSVLNGALKEDGSYDFTASFERVASYWQEPDIMIANLEVPLGGAESGEYTGYPMFNAPDSIADALLAAGVDVLLTANNHAYDTGDTGLLRTQEVLSSKGLEYVGTRLSEDETYVRIKSAGGITFGMVCYTYDTRSEASQQKSINGLTMSDETENLINSFCYSDLEAFYESAEADLRYMEEKGCDVTLFFMHWGDEYRDEPNDYQLEMSQRLCELGADVIIGGHPHVIEKFDVLTGEDGNKTYCIYSTGNAISSQRRDIMNEDDYRGYTEDGCTFEMTFEKYSDGAVRVSSVYVLPTWVEVTESGCFTLVPLDASLEPESWNTGNVYECKQSYNRTLGRLGGAYTALRSELGLSQVPDYLE